jgi:hypothetical protein
MAKVTKTLLNKEDSAAVEQSQSLDFKEKIKLQIFEKIGKPPRLDHVEVSPHQNGKYRVNIWQQPEPIKNLAVTVGPRIGLSYYLTVSDTGEIVHSNPPMTKL